MQFRVFDFEAYAGPHRLYVEGVRPEMETGRPAVLFVGGAFDGSWICRRQLDCWASRGWPSYALNLRGFYRSAWRDVARLSHLDYLDDIRTVVGRLRLGEPVLAGFSIGGLLLQKYAERHGARALILYDSDWPRAVAGMIGERPEPGARVPPVMNFWPSRAIVEEMAGGPVDRRDYLALLECFKRSFLSGRAYRELEIERIDVDASRITCPVLVVGVSAADRAQEALARYYGASRLVFEGHSHGSILISRFHAPVTRRVERWMAEGFRRGVDEIHRPGERPAVGEEGEMELFYHTGWREPILHLCDRRGLELARLRMERIGDGRTPREGIFRAACSLADGGGFFLSCRGAEDRPPWGGRYEPAGSRFHLRDGELFPDAPPRERSAPAYLTRVIPAREFGRALRVDVMLPRDYGSGGRYPVAVLNDGQNQWKGQGAYGGWHTDAIALDRARRGRARDIVLASVFSPPERDRAYLPPPHGCADRYIDFLADRLLPALRAEFALSRDPGEVALIGGSYAANCALFAGLARPDAFGLAGSFSYGEVPDDPVRRRMASLRALPMRRLYIDCGTRWAHDQPGRDDHTETTRALIALAREKGMAPGETLLGIVAEGHFHTEFYWRKRVGRCLEFLFPPA
ncbi:MAG: alpha/beta fold hydrolase [bacterium]|nr:alpha/beta fold hydrolase [bacterium]